MTFLPVYVTILLITIVIDYFAGIYIERSQGSTRKFYLILSLIGNVGFLCFFKYYDFFVDNINLLLSTSLSELKDLWISDYIIKSNNYINTNLNNTLGTHLTILKDIVLPIGLSFHTFQAMSYTIEVYRGNQKAEKHFGIYSLYVMFYPQLVAGPIERPQNILHQFHQKQTFNYDRLIDGMKLILWGLVKKIVIADRLALYVNAVYGNPADHSGLTLLFATILFSFQIYCDFSAYSEIAIGAARVMGFELMTNFKRPYYSKSMAEFWKRWHISLSSWFTDYVYIPLGGNRVAIPRAYLNITIIFLLSGFWHGANWTYILWGAVNAGYLIFGKILAPYKKKLNSAIGINEKSSLFHFGQILSTFILASFAWIFFRATSIADAKLIIVKILSFDGPLWYDSPSMIVYSLLAIALLLASEYIVEYDVNKYRLFQNSNWLVRNISYAVAIIVILLFGVFDGGQFIYFQF